MKEEVKARIDKDAEAYAKSLNSSDGTARFDYIAGASREHLKAWNEAIDKAQEKFIESTHLKWTPIEAWELLEMLKHKQP